MAQVLPQVKEFKKNLLKELLEKCTEKQQAFFHRVFPQFPDGIQEEKMDDAIRLCERTIKKNNKEKEIEKNG